jgi:transposase
MLNISFEAEALEAIKFDRFHHPHPRVQQKMWTLWLKACGLPHNQICQLVDITENTLRSYLEDYVQGGVEALRQLSFHRRQSELDKHSETLENNFRQNPPATVSEAQSRIAELTQVKRGPTQVRQYLHRLGMKFRKVAAVPAKAAPEVQEEFKKKSLNRGWSRPKQARGEFSL